MIDKIYTMTSEIGKIPYNEHIQNRCPLEKLQIKYFCAKNEIKLLHKLYKTIQ